MAKNKKKTKKEKSELIKRIVVGVILAATLFSVAGTLIFTLIS